jgi:hypothetical protein
VFESSLWAIFQAMHEAVEIGPDIARGEVGVRISGLYAKLTPEAKAVLDRRMPQ